MEVCEASVNYSYNVEEKHDEIPTSNLPQLAAILPAPASTNYGTTTERYPLPLPSGISGAVQRFSSQLVSVRERKLKSKSSYLANGGTMCHSVCKTTQYCDDAPTSSSSLDDLRFSDAMNQYLDDNFRLINNLPAEHSEENDDDGETCIVALDVPCCSRCHSCDFRASDRTPEQAVPSAPHRDADTCCSGDTNCAPETVVPLLPDPAAPRNGMPSPEMDFLDFDFDPAPSGDEMQGGESDNSSNDEGQPGGVPWEASAWSRVNGLLPAERERRSGRSATYKNPVSSPKYQNCLKSFGRANGDLCSHGGVEDVGGDNADPESGNMEACGERLLQRESSLFNIQDEEMDCVESNLQSVLLSSLGANRQGETSTSGGASSSKTTADGAELPNTTEEPVEKIMIWSELAACNRQVTQIGTSACGATAIINTLMALEVSFEKDEVEKHIHTRLRAEAAPVAAYLISRSSAGTTHEDLIDGVLRLTDGEIYGRFFHFYPSCTVTLTKWLSHWMRKGAIPVATLNLQCGVPTGHSVPDAWHHQMIFGVGPKGVYLTNPLECVPLSQIRQQLCSASVLLVRRNDILNRWGDDCDLGPLLTHEDERWRSMNVVGQVINILRESTAPWIPGYRRHLTSHVKIPAAYKSGISLFVHKNSDVYKELIKSKEVQ